MRRLILVLVFLLPGCSIINKPCSPPCGPGETCTAGVCVPVTPPPTCALPESGPICTEKTPVPLCFETTSAGANLCSWVCENGERSDPISCDDPRVISPICQDGQFCNCKHKPPGSDWIEATCAEGQECTVDKTCKAVEPPGPPPAGDACPKELAPGAYVYLRTTAYKPFVNFYATPYVHGDPEFCRLIHGVAIDDCHLESWPKQQACEVQLVGKAVGKPYACPVWEFSTDGGLHVFKCANDSAAQASCDHFGSTQYRDDPKTPTTGDTLETLRGFEGTPKECGLQRDQNGPMAGFFTVANGGPAGCTTPDGPYWRVRACLPDGTHCGQWREFCH